MAQTRDQAERGPRVDDPEGIALLRDVLVEAGFTPSAVRDTLATEVASGRDSAEMPLYLYMLRGGGKLATLIKLFLLDLEVTAAEAEEALAPLALDRLEAMGVLTVTGGKAKADIELVPTEDMLVACDAFQKELTRPDHVLGVSPPARVLAWLTVRRPVARALDLGTGNGHQALLAAHHVERITAIDINPRALRFAAFNAELNRAHGIEFREGNLFEPVAGEEFDLIVCNPPYVISPENEIVYRDGGLSGDKFCELIVSELPDYLAPGGIGEVLVSWLHPADGDWKAPIRRWVDDNGCDAVLLRYAVHEPLDYAAAWNRPYRTNPELYGAAIERWAAYFDELGVEAISWGCLILRKRPEGRNWFFSYTSATDRITGASDQVLRLFDAQDYLAVTSAEDMLGDAFTVPDDHRVEQTIRLRDGGEMIERNVLRLDTGLRFEVSIDAATERVLALLDGKRPLGDVLAEAAEITGAPPEAFFRSAVPVMRRMVELGFVLPA
jgi:methylase of polypeptide subunit release factors